MKKKIKVGVVGLGWAGKEHLKRYLENSHAKVVAVADPAEKTTDKISSLHKLKGYYDSEEMFEEEKLDAISICTPNIFHAPIAISAAERGISAITEKPMCTTSDEGRRMVKAAKKGGTKLMVAVCRRFHPASVYLKELVEDDFLGDINFARCSWLRHSGDPGRWFAKKNLSGGGPMLDIGVHLLDLTWWLMGCPEPKYCLGRAVGSDKENAVEDMAMAAITFEEGQIVHVGASWYSGWKSEIMSILMGDEGGASRYPLEIYKDINGKPTTLKPEIRDADSFQAEIDHFVDCVIEDKEPISNGEQGWTVVKILEAVYRSSEKNEPVKVR